MRPFISLCMIVKNEEKVIERCLSSIVNLVDEIIVVDTGSTDNTIELVAQYTKSIYEFEWINDFSAARNYAASKASGEWILVLDADEYIDEENFKEFILELKKDNGQYESYYAKILNFTGDYGEHLVQNFHDRIYKNNGDIEYHRKIHEQFRSATGGPLRNNKSNLLIFHSGYLKHTVSEKDKNQRNRELLDQEMKSGNNNAFDFFNLGNEYSSLGDYGKALDSYLEAYKLKRDFRLAWVSTTLVQIVLCLINLKRYTDAINVAKDAENIYINSPEFPYLKGEVFFQRGQLEDAKVIFQGIINDKEEYSHIIFRPDLKDQRPHLRLGEIYLFQEEYNSAIYHYTSVLNINKYNNEAISKVVEILSEVHTIEEIASFLISKELINEKNITSYVKACFEIGNPSLAIEILEDYSDEYQLLKKVAQLKNLIIYEQGEIKQFHEVFKPEIIKKLIESNWINIIDILLLRNYATSYENILQVFDSLKQNEQLNKLIDLVDGNESVINVDEGLVIYALQAFFAYKQYDLCNVILDEIETTDNNTVLKIARVLFNNGFKGEALQLYNLCDWNKFDEQDFVNIINCLMKSNSLNNALDVSNYAIMNKNNFRFYQFAIEILNALGDDENKEKYITNALMEYPDSLWLRNQYLQS
ncbi:tetratricopeptide repeat-containing glycosyltransferase family 2 protein [Fredinandcohnia onubensis]|uniref:tetratricopeptide repeat-containing glycosyltransferase family 2 protein n=1 Tax=Fredinandcohnia onubensis TaxID=1571209 RepID=UPI000C0BDEDB|nr:glycosyltransferase family 2 protein [Fredinandcohnia onubensis]